MKPLTIEQLKALKVGDWVWIADAHGDLGSYARKCVRFNENEFQYETIETYEAYNYSDYGRTWLAYKNKEQAEGADFEDNYYALKAAIVEVCDKLNNKQYNDKFYSLTLGGKIQRIETIEEQKLKERKGVGE